MRHTVVVDADGAEAPARVRETNGWLSRSPLAGGDGDTVVVTARAFEPAAIVALAPCGDVTVIRVAAPGLDPAIEALIAHVEGRGSELVLFADDGLGRERAVRLADRLGGSSLLGVTAIAGDPVGLLCDKAIRSGRTRARFRLRRPPYCLTLAPGAAAPMSLDRAMVRIAATIDRSDLGDDRVRLLEVRPAAPSGLAQAERVVVAGQGLRGRAAIERVAGLARVIGAEFAVSRPVAMNGWAPIDRMVGVSGTRLDADLCIVVGASGAAALLAGIDRCRRIVAINSDPAAPIFACADIGVVGDGVAVLEAMARVIAPDAAGAVPEGR